MSRPLHKRRPRLPLTVLKEAKTLHDVAEILGFKPKTLGYIVRGLSPAAKYNTFLVSKRAGGSRKISAPTRVLKAIQRNLADHMQDWVEELNASNKRTDRAAHGFVRKRSIVTNARTHRRHRWVFNIDLKDFFPSINFGRVRGYLISNNDFQLDPVVATLVAQIACTDDGLPQGSPCSPVFANLIAHHLDIRLVELAARNGCSYSRYADDITFSTNKKSFPPEIAVLQNITGDASTHLWLPSDQLRKIIEKSGFIINDLKTNMMYGTSRQRVTGLVVNRKVNTTSEYRRNLRAMVHKLVTTGSFDLLGPVFKEGSMVLEKRAGTLDELHGMLGFADSVHLATLPSDVPPPEKPTAGEQSYRRFLFYRLFQTAKLPVVICEGGTDNVYLTHAIRSLAALYPELAQIESENKISLLVRLYKYPKSSTARLLDLKGGGSSQLANFIGTYHKVVKRFAGRARHPVIILFDNDSGAKAVRGAIKSISGKKVPSDAEFVHLSGSLYAVPTPGENSKIEDFFDDATRAEVIDGKTFNPNDDDSFDKASHYGKNIFAHAVIRANADAIDFSGFRPLLDRPTTVIRTHR